MRRGEAATRVRLTAEKFGEESQVCFAGSRPGETCDRPAVMEVYGVPMCEAHGEEAASGAFHEIANDLGQELQRLMNPEVRALSPHLEAALQRGFEVLPEEAGAYERDEKALLFAFPLDRGRVDAETLAYAEDPDANGRGRQGSPHDDFMHARLLICRHLRLAFEADADWLVETLEMEREEIAAQTAYALALGREAGLR